jgi:hypothetical protein
MENLEFRALIGMGKVSLILSTLGTDLYVIATLPGLILLSENISMLEPFSNERNLCVLKASTLNLIGIMA